MLIKKIRKIIFPPKKNPKVIQFHHLVLQKVAFLFIYLFFTWDMKIHLLYYKKVILIFVPFSKVLITFPLKDIWSVWDLKREA